METNIFVFIAGEDIKKADYLIQDIGSGKIYISKKNTIGLIFGCSAEDVKEGEKIKASFPLFGVDVNDSHA